MSGAAAGEDPRITRNRQVVHAAAMRLVESDGIAGLTVDRLAEISGVSRSTIYRHWPDLDALVVDAFDGVVHEHGSRRSASPADPVQGLLDYLHDYARRLNDPTYATVLVTIIEWSLRDPRFAGVHDRTFAGNRSRAASIVRAGRRAGVFRRDLDVSGAVEDVVSPFLYRRLVLRRNVTVREVRALHARLCDQFAR